MLHSLTGKGLEDHCDTSRCQDWTETIPLLGLMKPVRDISFSPSGKLLAVCGDFQVIAIYDVHSGEQVFNFTGHTSWVFSIRWSETGQFLATRFVLNCLLGYCLVS